MAAEAATAAMPRVTPRKISVTPGKTPGKSRMSADRALGMTPGMTPGKTPTRASAISVTPGRKTPGKATPAESTFADECVKWMGCLPARERVKLEAALAGATSVAANRAVYVAQAEAWGLMSRR